MSKILALVVIFLLVVPLVTYLETWALCWAWNLVMAGAFHAPVITMWQALALLVLMSILTTFFRLNFSNSGNN